MEYLMVPVDIMELKRENCYLWGWRVCSSLKKGITGHNDTLNSSNANLKPEASSNWGKRWYCNPGEDFESDVVSQLGAIIKMKFGSGNIN